MKAKNRKVTKQITDYDNSETGSFINKKNKLSFQDIGLKLPKQELIKRFLAEAMKPRKT
jgi:hypothetical protein